MFSSRHFWFHHVQLGFDPVGFRWSGEKQVRLFEGITLWPVAPKKTKCKWQVRDVTQAESKQPKVYLAWREGGTERLQMSQKLNISTANHTESSTNEFCLCVYGGFIKFSRLFEELLEVAYEPGELVSATQAAWRTSHTLLISKSFCGSFQVVTR